MNNQVMCLSKSLLKWEENEDNGVVRSCDYSQEAVCGSEDGRR